MTIWSYWEGPRPPFIDLCWRTVQRHNQDARLVGPDDVSAMGGRSILESSVGLPHAIRADLVRAWLLYTHGGIWLDSDVICLAPFDWQPEKFDLICVRKPHTKAHGAGGIVACPWGCRAGSPLAERILSGVKVAIQRMQAGHHVTYGETSTGVLSRVYRTAPPGATVQVRQPWRYCPVHWSHARAAFLRRGTRHKHETAAAWRPGATCYHLTNPITHAYQAATEPEILADPRFASFLLSKSLGLPSALPGRSWEILRRLPADRPAVAVEVGVFKGNNAVQLLQQRSDLTLYLVDPWDVGTEDYRRTADYQARFRRSRWNAIYSAVCRRLAFAGQRARMIRAPSVAGAAQIPDGSVDLVFVDGNHSRPAVAADVAAWAPKIRPGGWIGGHDYHHPRAKQRRYGVTEAVDAWAAATGRQIETGRDLTWFVQID